MQVTFLGYSRWKLTHCLMLGSKVVVVLNMDKAEVVLLFRTEVVEEMATRGGQTRLSRAEVGETGQGLLFQVEEVAPGEQEDVVVYMDGQGQAKLYMMKNRDVLEQIGVDLGVELL